MIEYKDVKLQIQDQILLKQANLVVQDGEHVVIRGISGCGKSSLLRATVGALPIASGSIEVDEIPLSNISLTYIRGRISFIGQEPILGGDTVRESLMLPFKYKAHKDDAPGLEQILQTLELLQLPANILEKPSKSISAGEKQRMAIVRGLLLEKNIFIADEITSALDPVSKKTVMDVLFNSGITLLSVSHDPDWIQRCDRVIHFYHQRLSEET